MSVSSHLTPEPERRLWALMDGLRQEVDRLDIRLFGLAALAFGELFYLKTAAPAGWVIGLAVLSLALSLPLAILSLSPAARLPAWLAFIEPAKDKQTGADRLFVAEDIAKYSHGELINKLDRYFGGGITATQYYEDLVGEALVNARLAHRKARLLGWVLTLVAAGQVLLLSAWLSPRM